MALSRSGTRRRWRASLATVGAFVSARDLGALAGLGLVAYGLVVLFGVAVTALVLGLVLLAVTVVPVLLGRRQP